MRIHYIFILHTNSDWFDSKLCADIVSNQSEKWNYNPAGWKKTSYFFQMVLVVCPLNTNAGVYGKPHIFL